MTHVTYITTSVWVITQRSHSIKLARDYTFSLHQSDGPEIGT